MGTLIEIQNQIEKLQKQAKEIRAREFDNTVAQILVQMAAFGITLNDLRQQKSRPEKGGAKTAKRVAKRPAAKAPKSPLPAKYQGPNGETWTGRGLPPRWLAKLMEEGQGKEHFLIKG